MFSRWNERDYFKKIFDDIDHNHDGQINFFELYEALKRGQPTSKFDPNTVKVLLNKYDSDHDNEISFNEFYNLFVGINEQMNAFLDIDMDSSGSIDMNELNRLLKSRRMEFSPSFFNFLFNDLNRRLGINKITFDIYVRLIARIDKLKNDFQQQNINQNFENYIKTHFFINF